MKKQSIEKVLEELVQLFKKWGLSLNDWCLVGEWALVLGKYEIKGRENDIDVYVARESLPWKVKEERQAVPPGDSKYFDDWVEFTETTGFGLDMIPIPESPTDLRTKVSIVKDTTFFRLPNGDQIRINTPLAEVKIHRWLFQQYNAEDVGQENLDRWWRYIKDIKKAATKKRDKKVIEACQKLLDNSKFSPYTES